MTTTELLTIPETAKRIRKSRHTVYRLIHSGQLTAVITSPAGTPILRVRTTDLDQYIASLATVLPYAPKQAGRAKPARPARRTKRRTAA